MARKTKAKPSKQKPKAKATKRPARRPAKKAVVRLQRKPADEGVGLVTLDDDAMPLVTLDEQGEEQEAAAEPEEVAEPRMEMPLTGEWSLPEQFLGVAIQDDWDDRMEKAKVGRQGAALAASLLLELAVRGRLRIHLDRYQVVGEPTGDPALDDFANEVEARGEMKTQETLQRIGNRSSQFLAPWRGRLHRRGVAREERWRFLGVFPRSRMLITDREAKQKLENRLQRTLVGGTPDVRTILLLALIDAAGLLPEIIPAGALAYNRKRIQSLLAGRDPLGYRVDPALHDMQGALVQTLLRDVRVLQGNRD
ncbi:MAG: GPP34 family phosphoprotein [Halobacteriales archaeon]|nr:GPP34 family phosphoprotein [Halobacteriales archaeon]